MNEPPLLPENLDQLTAILAECPQVIAVGNQTKRPLTLCDGASKVSLASFRGITEYQPSEFTFTAMAGTPVAEISAALAAKSQYLPFDPLLADAGATIGGSVAAGLSGPGRFRFGGIRDFLLGVQFLSGDGKVIRAGGKVVKNAAGFDIPKFLVGSLGRYGLLLELTFKVFPKPVATTTLRLQCDDHDQATTRMSAAASSCWELDAIDYRPDQQSVYLRIAGPESANDSIARQIKMRWGRDVSDLESAAESWRDLTEFRWPDHHRSTAKIPITPQFISPLSAALPGKLWFSAAGNVLWQGLRDNEQLNETNRVLTNLDRKGLIVAGDEPNVALGNWQANKLEPRLKSAFDPANKYPALLDPAN